MRIITSALVVATTYNFAGCKDTPASLEKKITALEARMEAAEMDDPAFVRSLREGLIVPQGGKLNSQTRRSLVADIKRGHIYADIAELNAALSQTQDSQKQATIKAKMLELARKLVPSLFAKIDAREKLNKELEDAYRLPENDQGKSEKIDKIQRKLETLEDELNKMLEDKTYSNMLRMITELNREQTEEEE